MNIHFTGIGGIGMSALARYFLAYGEKVSGSDSSQSPITAELKQEGVQWIAPNQAIPENTELHIYTEAVPEQDIQRQSAKSLKIPSRSYFQQLGEISKNYKTIAVCGTHGKSTTTAMIGIALSKAELDPLVIVGTKVREFGGKNIYLGARSQESGVRGGLGARRQELGDRKGEKEKMYFPNSYLLTPVSSDSPSSCLLIVEACEYRESFLNLHPFGVVLTNCEHDHADYYKTEESYKNAFKKFVSRIPKDGFLIANFDDAIVREVAEFAQCEVIPVRLSQMENPITPKVPGWHNQLNAELAFATCQKTNIKYQIPNTNREESGVRSQESGGKEEFLDQIEKSLLAYAGTWRRFDILGEKNGVMVIDDYGHHPSEVRATLKALKEYAALSHREGKKKIVVLFQPHQYSRTRELFDDFVEAFSSELSTVNSQLFITDIYEARDTEDDKKAVSAEMLANAIQKRGIMAEYSGNYEQSLKKLKNTLQVGDILLTMGAGPVNEVAEAFLGK